MRVGIDSSEKDYSGIVVGRKAQMDLLYKDLHEIFRSVGGHGNMHWQELSPSQRKLFHKRAFEKIKDSGVSFILLKHKRPGRSSKKEFYMDAIPSHIADALHPFIKEHKGDVQIHVGNDYNVKDVHNASNVFLKKIVDELGVKLTGKRTKAFQKKMNEGIEVKNVNGENLRIWGKVADAFSNQVQLSDVLLGLYKQDREDRRVKKKRYMEFTEHKKI